jgi:hypothetical protein
MTTTTVRVKIADTAGPLFAASHVAYITDHVCSLCLDPTEREVYTMLAPRSWGPNVKTVGGTWFCIDRPSPSVSQEALRALLSSPLARRRLDLLCDSYLGKGRWDKRPSLYAARSWLQEQIALLPTYVDARAWLYGDEDRREIAEVIAERLNACFCGSAAEVAQDLIAGTDEFVCATELEKIIQEIMDRDLTFEETDITYYVTIDEG